MMMMMNIMMKMMENVLEGINQCWTLTQMDLSSARMWRLLPSLQDSAQGNSGELFAQCALREVSRSAGHIPGVFMGWS